MLLQPLSGCMGTLHGALLHAVWLVDSDGCAASNIGLGLHNMLWLETLLACMHS